MTYDAVFVSDVHLGTERCNVEKFLNFLKTIQTKKLVMVGDIIDIYCMEKHKTRWKKQHTDCIHQILKLSKSGTEIVYILGNHERTARRYCDFKFGNVTVCNEYVYETLGGKKYICFHGDAHSEYSSGSWKQLIFNTGYELVTPLSHLTEKYFKISIVTYLKNSIRGKKYINRYETDIANQCRKKGNYNGVICGHIHHANIRKFDDIIYMCCGDFVDSSTAIVEKNGIFQIIKY